MKNLGEAVLVRPNLGAEPLLSASELSCYRGERLLFSRVDLEVRAHELLQIHGPNGSGKTTLLRILCGLTLPTEGEIRWRGTNIQSNSSEYFSEVLHVGHTDGVKLELSPSENLRFARSLGNHPTEIEVAEVLERLDLYGFEDIPTRTLSAGQRRRVALARLLLTHAKLWILDEPFTSLDKAGINAMELLLTQHLDQGGIVILTSHNPIRLGNRPMKELHLFS